MPNYHTVRFNNPGFLSHKRNNVTLQSINLIS